MKKVNWEDNGITDNYRVVEIEKAQQFLTNQPSKETAHKTCGKLHKFFVKKRIVF